MAHNVRFSEQGKKKASVSATVIFVALAVFVVYGAVRLMGDALLRFRQTPSHQAEQLPAVMQTDPSPQVAPQAVQQIVQEPTPTPAADGEESVVLTEEREDSEPQSTEKPILSEDESTQTMAGVNCWSGTRYATAFSEGQRDMVIALSDDAGRLTDVCILALRGDRIHIVAVPGSCMLEDGRLLSDFSSARAAVAMRLLLPVEFDRYLVFPKGLLSESIDAIGPLKISGRLLDGAEATEYLEAAPDAPLLRAERFSHLLCALPESISGMSLFRLLRLKTALQEEVKTNIEDAEGWEFINAVRKLKASQITELTLPVETAVASEKRAYRPDAELTEQVLKNLYKTSEKTS